MGRLFGRPAPTTPGDATPPPRPHLRVLRAAGARIDLSRRDAGQMLAATRQPWQAQAWQYRNLIAELRYALRLRARSVARCRYYLAVSQPWPQDPVPLEGGDHKLSPQLVADAIACFARIPFDTAPDGFTARFDENLGVAGEGWVHIDADEQFWVRSTSEITANAGGQITLNTLPTAVQGSTRQIDPETEDLLRCWVPDPEWGSLADAPLRPLLDVCEDVALAGRELRAAARSRVAANGILLMPDTMSMVQARSDEEEHDDSVASDTFMADFTASLLAPLRTDGDAQEVVPIVLRGAVEDIAAVRHLTLQRADAEKLIERQSAALMRLLKGLDIQPEQVEGVGGMNHWGAWIVDSRAIRDQVEPAAETVASCLAQAYLRPALRALGDHAEADIKRIMIAVDTSPLSENPNRGQDAVDAHRAGAISDATFREAKGFSEDDAPDDAERLYRLAADGRLSPELTAAVLGITLPGGRERITVQGETVAPAALPAAPQRQQAAPGQVVQADPLPDQPAGSQAPTGPVVAAAGPADDVWRVEVARQLADIDAALLDRITTAADAAIARVVERAGARTRSAARRDQTVTAALVGVEAHLIASRLGRAQVEQFVPVNDLLTDSYARLRGQVLGWLADAAEQVADAVLDVLRIGRGTPRAREVRGAVTSRLGQNRDQAWQVLAEALDQAAERALFAPDPFDPDATLPGEGVGTLIRPGEVRRALDAAGGGGGGFGTGPAVQRVFGEEGGVVLGYEWLYHPEITRPHPFLWHQRLDGLRFATYTDPKLDTEPKTAWLGLYYRPGDHDGCLCTSIPIIAFPELDDGIVARRLREAAGNPRNIMAGQVAAEDDRAGRVGTSLQNEVEVRTRITDAVERLQREHIEQSGTAR